MRTRAEIDRQMGVGVYEKTQMTATKSPKFSQKQKSSYPTRRYQSLRKRIKAIIQTAMATVILCGIWQMLEYLIYGEVQPRIVDDIMMLFFIQFIYISARD